MAAKVFWYEQKKSWYVVDRRPGKPRKMKAFGPTDVHRDEAQAFVDALNAEMEERAARVRALTGPGKPIFGADALRGWFDAAKDGLGESRRRQCHWLIEAYLIPGFGGLDLRRLRREHITSFAGKMAQVTAEHGRGRKLGHHTIRQMLSVFRRVLHWLAEDDQLEFRIPGSIAGKVVSMGGEAARAQGAHEGEREAWNREEAYQLLEISRASALYPILLAALHTGARKGELLGLDWQHVDLSSRTIKIRQILTYTDKIKPTPKTRRSRRDVSLSPELTELLRQMSKARAAQIGLSGEEPGRVFRCGTGKPWTYSGLDSSWKTLSLRAYNRHAVRMLPLHSFRHTYVSWALDAHENIGWIAAQIGDRASTMLTTYAHFVRGSESDHSFLSEPRSSGSRPRVGEKAVRGADS